MSAGSSFLAYAFLTAHLLVLGLLCTYALHRYHLVYLFHKHRPQRAQPAAAWRTPSITIQVPIYNERYVIAALLDSIRHLDYPRNCLEVQILDDSTDDTPRIVQRIVTDMRREGMEIHHLCRAERTGYKAGALAVGLDSARGELIAIFDADFRPPPGFLKQILPYFREEDVGMVQARWGYLNEDHSLLTRLQAMFLDAHFMIEHFVRHRSGRFFNFNGTAGVWRRTCIETAGGWQADTLTEDLDISYRAQLAGWRFVFAPEVVVPSELPVELAAFKTQQHRWAKGSVQTALKLLPAVLSSPHPWPVKLEALFHLAGNLAYLLMIGLLLTLLPSLAARAGLGWQALLWLELPVLLLATPSVFVFYLTARRALDRGRGLLHIPPLMALGIGLAVNNSRAVLAALLGRTSEFRRTPKHGVGAGRRGWMRKRYRGRLDYSLVLELLLATWSLVAIQVAWRHELYVALPFLALFLWGFTYVAAVALAQTGGAWCRRRWRTRALIGHEGG